MCDLITKHAESVDHRLRLSLHYFIRLGGPEGLQLNPGTLNDYELVIASHLVVPDDISVSWSDIAGLDAVIEELRESVVLPIRHRHLFANSQLWEAPKGRKIWKNVRSIN